jgi:hypothetical protein
MERKEAMLESLKANMDALDSATTWIFITLLIIVLSSFGSSDKLEFASIKIKKKYGGLLVYGMMVGLNFQVLKLLHNISSLISQVPNCDAKIVLNTHPGIFNPFAEFGSESSLLFDHLGYALMIVIWWIGNAVAFKMLHREELKIRCIGFVLAGIYVLLGFASMMLIGEICYIICENSSLKYEMAVVGIIVGGLIVLFMAYLSWKRAKTVKENE